MIPYDACRAMFGMTDLLRRAQGQTFEAFGLGPQECPYEVVTSGAFWRHRDYGKPSAQSVLIVAAPIKRAYIWDLVPSSSAIRYILHQGFHVHLLEWLPAETTFKGGLDEAAAQIDCLLLRDKRARPHHATDAARPRRRGDRMDGGMSADGTKRTFRGQL
jgi:hypothetical protein